MAHNEIVARFYYEKIKVETPEDDKKEDAKDEGKDETITSDDYTIKEEKITKISSETNISDFKKHISSKTKITVYNADGKEAKENGTLVYVAYNQQYCGYIVIADELKTDAKAAIKRMKACGIREIVMLTGDNETTARFVVEEIGMDKYYAGLFPKDKVRIFEELLEKADGKVAFVGDGINDAPVLARADVGIAMGGLGSDAAIEAADIVIMNDEPSKIAKMIALSRKTLAIVKENIVFAIGIKVAILILAAVGIANMWLAVFADVGVAALAILNAMRTLKSVD